MDRVEDAAKFAQARGVAKWRREVLDERAAVPLRVSLEGTTIIPFTAVPMGGVDFSDSLPGIAAKLNVEDVVAHFDSGGAFLVMSPDTAKRLGIKLIEGERSFANLAWDRSYFGIAKSFIIGEALLENVLVTAWSASSPPLITPPGVSCFRPEATPFIVAGPIKTIAENSGGVHILSRA